MKFTRIKDLDKSVIEFFKDTVFIDESCNSQAVPVLFSTSSKLLQSDRLRLPLIAVNRRNLNSCNTHVSVARFDYFIEILSIYEEDVAQILEQILNKISHSKDYKFIKAAKIEGDSSIKAEGYEQLKAHRYIIEMTVKYDM